MVKHDRNSDIYMFGGGFANSKNMAEIVLAINPEKHDGNVSFQMKRYTIVYKNPVKLRSLMTKDDFVKFVNSKALVKLLTSGDCFVEKSFFKTIANFFGFKFKLELYIRPGIYLTQIINEKLSNEEFNHAFRDVSGETNVHLNATNLVE